MSNLDKEESLYVIGVYLLTIMVYEEYCRQQIYNLLFGTKNSVSGIA